MVLGGESYSAPTVVIIFYFISFLITYFMQLIACQVTAGYFFQSNRQEGQITFINIATAIELKQQTSVAR
jgi:hypothetical protein